MTNFEEVAKTSARKRISNIVIIPGDVKIDKSFLISMDNGAFVDAFRVFQEQIINIYEEIEKAPFDWGYPTENNSDGIYSLAYNRISDFLYAIGANSTLDGGKLVVDNNGYKAVVKKHKKVELIITNLQRMGFQFDGLDKKAVSFTVSYAENPRITEILYYYTKAQDLEIAQSAAQYATFASFSYRWVQDPSEQKHETIFLVKMDMSPRALQDIQYWLYDKAKAYGYTIDKKKPFDKDCIYYKKGSKAFIHVGEREIDGKSQIFTKVIFRSILTAEPEKINSLVEKFPDTFGKSYATCTRCNGRKSADESCSMRIDYTLDGTSYENCAYHSFYFINPTLDTFKDIFDLFIMENKIK